MEYEIGGESSVSQEIYHSRRMLLRPTTTRQKIYDYGKKMGWNLLNEEGDPANRENFRADFGVAPDAGLHYVEDFISKQSYTYVTTPTEFATNKLSTLIRDDLDVYPIEDLLETVDQADGLNQGRALMRLGVGAPYEFNDAVFRRITDGLTHENPDVRHLAMWGSAYSPWQEYLPYLRRIAEDDDAPLLRERASDVLSIFKSQGVAES